MAEDTQGETAGYHRVSTASLTLDELRRIAQLLRAGAHAARCDDHYIASYLDYGDVYTSDRDERIASEYESLAGKIDALFNGA